MIYQIPNLTLTESKSLSGIYVSDHSQHDYGISKVMGNIVAKFILLRDFRSFLYNSNIGNSKKGG